MGNVPGLLPPGVDGGDGTGVTYTMFDYISGILLCNPNIPDPTFVPPPGADPDDPIPTIPDPNFTPEEETCGFAPGDPGANSGNINVDPLFVALVTAPSSPGATSAGRIPVAPYVLTRGIAALNRQTTNDWWNLSYAWYGQASFFLTEDIELTAGLRYTRERKEREGDVESLFVQDVEPPDVVDQKKFDSRWTPMAQMSWNATTAFEGWIPADDLFLYAQYAKGWKSGGFNESVLTEDELQDAIDGGLEDELQFDPETSDAYEIGVKTQWFDRHMTVNLSAFLNDYQDIQITTLGVDAEGILSLNIRNAGQATIKGFELEMSGLIDEGLLPKWLETVVLSTWLPGENHRLVLGGGLGYTDAEYDDFSTRVLTVTQDDIANNPQINPSLCTSLRFESCPGDPTATPPAPAGILGIGGILGALTQPETESVDRSDNDFKNTPEWNFNLSTTYLIDLGERVTLASRLDYSWQSHVFYDTDNDVRQNAYGLFDGRMWLDVDDVYRGVNGTIAFWMKNILDRRFVDGAVSLGDTVGADIEFAGRPRTFGGEITLRY